MDFVDDQGGFRGGDGAGVGDADGIGSADFLLALVRRSPRAALAPPIFIAGSCSAIYLFSDIYPQTQKGSIAHADGNAAAR